jgi:conjugative transposon TraM protein
MKQMKSEKKSQAFLRKRKMLMVLPLLVIPFLTMAFWAMGGGKGNHEQKQNTIQGLNLNLPDPKQKDDKFLDKLSFYDKADKDSAKLAEWMRSDPYYKEKKDTGEPVSSELEQLTQTTATKYNQRLNVSPYDKTDDAPEQKVMQKLSVLQKELNKNSSTTKNKDTQEDENYLSKPEFSSEVNRLENMMNQMNNGNTDDPEMKQLSTVMDKILDVQHPERVKQRMKEKTIGQKENVFTISNQADDDTIVKGFYGLENETITKESNAIQAVVNENQVLVNGAVIKLRLINDIFINKSKIPAGNFVFGIVSLNGERLEIEINSIRSNNSLYAVKMEVYDMDGLPGIYVPGAISRDVAKQSADNSLQLMEMTSLDPSLKAQATAAGIGTLKNLISKKVKLVKVMVKAGYKVLLKDKAQQ